MKYGNNLLKTAYRATFPLGASVAATAYGAITRRRKLGHRFRQRLTELEQQQWLSTSELMALSEQRVLAFARQALRNVPYYRQQTSSAAVRKHRLATIDDFRHLPMLKKETVRRAPRSFRPDGHDDHHEIRTQTSGTTGSALEVWISPHAYQDEYAFVWLHRGKAGLRPGARTATFAGHPVVPIDRRRPPFWARNLADNQILFSSYHLAEQWLPAYVEALRRSRPELIHGYPSAIAEIARAVLDAGADDIRPRAVLPASETLLGHQRELIARAFECPVLDWYGNTELAGHITECPSGSHHVQHLHSFVEIIRDDGKPAGAGEEGEIVATNFANNAMPLIRYRTGDTARLGIRDCDCGRGGTIVDALTGRLDDVVVTPDGRRIGRLDHIFKETPEVREGQIRQLGNGTVRLLVVPAGPWTEALSSRLTMLAVQRLGSSAAVEVKPVETIARTTAGKFRAVISDLARAPETH